LRPLNISGTNIRCMKNSKTDPHNRIIVIGGGPAGMMAAGRAAQLGQEVVLLEQNPFLGKKLNITGKGRCNLTNNCTAQEVLSNVMSNPRFLYSSLSAFTPADTIAFF